MSRAITGTMREVVLSQVGEYSFAIDSAWIGSIADVDSETAESAAEDESFYDLSTLAGTEPPKGQRRMLEISSEDAFLLLLTGSQVRLQNLHEMEPVPTPDFLQHLWQDLHVQALLPTDPPALLLDIPALLKARRPSVDD